MQYHSEFNHHQRPRRDRTPWYVAETTGDERVVPQFKRFADLRERLVGYLAEQAEVAASTRALYAPELARNGYGEITTEVRPVAEAGPFYYAEEYHQQYLHKVPNGYCPVHSTGVACPVE